MKLKIKKKKKLEEEQSYFEKTLFDNYTKKKDYWRIK